MAYVVPKNLNEFIEQYPDTMDIWVWSFLQKVPYALSDKEDIKQEIYLKFMRARTVESYNLKPNERLFLSYLHHCAYNMFKSLFANHMAKLPLRMAVSLDTFETNDYDPKQFFTSDAAAPNVTVDIQNEIDTIYKYVIARTQTKHRDIVNLVFKIGFDKDEIARLTGKKVYIVSRVITQTRKLAFQFKGRKWGTHKRKK